MKNTNIEPLSMSADTFEKLIKTAEKKRNKKMYLKNNKPQRNTLALNLVQNYAIKERLKAMSTEDKLDALRVLSKEAAECTTMSN